MPTIRKRGHKWQVQVRRLGLRPISRSFHVLKDAQAWARHMEQLAVSTPETKCIGAPE